MKTIRSKKKYLSIFDSLKSFYNQEDIASILCAFVSVATLFLTWELLGKNVNSFSRMLPSPSIFLPALAHSGFRIGTGASSGGIIVSILSSFYRVFAGLFIAFSLSMLASIFISRNVWIKRFCLPLVELFAPIAPLAWIPLALVLFGIGNKTAIFIVFMGVFFSLTIATVKIIETVPSFLISVSKSFGATRFQLWRFVILPYILPQVFTTLRLNFIIAWVAVLAAEMTGLRDGLGAIIMHGRNLFNSNLIVFGMSLIGISGFFIDSFMKMIQKKFFWWDSI